MGDEKCPLCAKHEEIQANESTIALRTIQVDYEESTIVPQTRDFKKSGKIVSDSTD